MAFPSNPTNGATHTIGTTTFTYNSSTNQWKGVIAASSGGSSAGGGSMAAPTHFGRFTTNVSFNSTDHAAGSAYGYIGQTLSSGVILDIKSKATNGNMSIQKDSASYGTAIVAGGTMQDFSGLPQFCSDADYLASNPTYFSSNPSNPSIPATTGNYYCASGGYVRYTTDSGATFNTYIPQIMSDGTIKLTDVGKYKVKVKHICEISGISNYYLPPVHTLILINDVIKTNYVDRAGWEPEGQSSTANNKAVLRTEFDAILDITSPNTSFSLGIAKLGTNALSTSTFIVSVESLF